ncbi:T3SS effector HopA1 family protein [Endozoicomonas numazuensis]|uniref:Uncharacterized protein n=1 Tax=Endozoicomonas numazuensis TaxID=1137799 RepID=A0A081NIS9_9GAMM|nr:T3SS effector HopA1 family protein [Endozoicomonas numazuensis]KEQ18352.1 hypothetical protein GZ78_12645 [Endozoicomonas numazuensis]
MDPTPPPSSHRLGDAIDPPSDSKEIDETRPQTTQGEVQQGIINQRHISHVQGPARKALQHWAEEAARMSLNSEKSTQTCVRDLYRRDCPKQAPRPLTNTDARMLLGTIVRLEKKYDLLRVSMREFNVGVASMLDSPNFRETQYFFAFQDLPDEGTGDGSRLTLNLHPDKVKEVIEVLVEMMHQAPWSELIRKTKIQALSRLGKTTDCLVVYCTFSPDQVMALAQAVDEKIPKGFRLEHTPFGMERIYTGIAYSERKEGDSGSHGNSRNKVICRALRRCRHNSDLDLTRILNEELLLSGYDPENPARLARTNDFMEIVSKLARDKEPTVQLADIELECRGLFGRNTSPPEMTRESERVLKKLFEQLQGQPDLRVQRLGYGMRPLSEPSLGVSNEAAVRFLKVSRADGVRGAESSPWAVLTLCLSPENTVKSSESLLAELERLKQEQKPAFLIFSSPETIKRSGTAAALYVQSGPGSVQQCVERLADCLKGSVQENACIPVMEKCSEGIFYSEALNSRDSFDTSRGAAVAMGFRKTIESGYFLENLSEALQVMGVNPENPAKLL